MSNLHISSVNLHPEQYPTAKHYPFSLPIFNHSKELQFETSITFFIGENGTGKSTLLEAIALAANIHIWNRNDGISLEGNPYEKQLHRYLSIEWTKRGINGSYFGSEIFNDFRKIVDGWATSDPGQLKYFGGKSLVAQSHGQSMMAYFESRYKIEGIYFLDEPETALSPKNQLKLLDILQSYSQDGHAQFFIATHSPILLGSEGAKIFSFDQNPISSIDYKDTDYYKLYKQFLSER